MNRAKEIAIEVEARSDKTVKMFNTYVVIETEKIPNTVDHV